MGRGQPKDCTKCGRTHWSIDSSECAACRKPLSKRKPYGPRQTMLDRDVDASPSIVRSAAGRCLGPSLMGSPSEAEKRCRVHWRRLSHRHCPTVGCGRAMAVGAVNCGACTALELFEPQARELRLITNPEPLPDPFAGIDPYSDRAHEEYLADMQGLPGAVAIAI